MVFKWITFLSQTATFNKDIRKWRRQTTYLNIWATFKTILHQAHLEQSRAVANVVKGIYTAVVQNIYGVPPAPPEEHHKALYNLNNIVRECRRRVKIWEGWYKPIRYLPDQTHRSCHNCHRWLWQWITCRISSRHCRWRQQQETRTKSKFYC